MRSFAALRRLRMTVCASIIAIGSVLPTHAQTTRIASDFEIQQMQQQAAREREFTAQFAAHMNLGDSRTTRNESSLAVAEYRTAANIAEGERADARKAGDMRRYATATMYVALADSKLNAKPQAFEMLEEALRYSSDDAKTWNIYASAMTALGEAAKAAGAARNAVAITEEEAQSSPSMARSLDLAIYRYSLATALAAMRQDVEAERLLETVLTSLNQKEFDRLRKAVARSESFEIYSTTRADTSAYLSLRNHSRLHLAGLYEEHGETAKARRIYEDVLADRTDDPTALEAIARLSRTTAERAEAFADAFDANPFSIALIRDYEQWLKKNPAKPNDARTDGALVRRALEQRAAEENVAARETLDRLAAKFPQNDVVHYLAARNDIDLGDLSRARTRGIGVEELKSDIDARLTGASAPAPAFLAANATSVAPPADELRQLMAYVEQQRIKPDERTKLDRLTFTNTVVFDEVRSAGDGRTIFESGSIERIPFRFSEPIAFAGTFAAKTPLVLTYRFLGVTDLNGASALLLEPVKLEVPR